MRRRKSNPIQGSDKHDFYKLSKNTRQPKRKKDILHSLTSGMGKALRKLQLPSGYD